MGGKRISADCDFTRGQVTGSALPYDFFEHVVRQDKRDDESRVIYRAPKMRLQAISYSEVCERCGRNLRRVYLWNGKRLCKSCMEDGQKSWTLFTGGPDAESQRIPIRPLEKARKSSLFESLISGLLALFGLRWIDKETGIEEPDIQRRRARLPAVKRPDKKQMPEAEGIMNRKKRRT